MMMFLFTVASLIAAFLGMVKAHHADMGAAVLWCAIAIVLAILAVAWKPKA
jgi:hypothetical protein